MGMLAAKISEIWNNLSGISVLLALVAVVFALAIYFLPTILAAAVGNATRRVAVIAALNLLFAWTGLGWFALVGWAILGRPRESDDTELTPFVHTTPGTG